ncbi:AraC family transcriptional regulator [Pseudoalteromonas sp. OOF1S-7]|uniref:AraC family transcriptional regulator n=1 Tax=Pseudoalteromonas sp. OOF1S-7 TaxID=2917757 RepID=UPI001EF624D1|nr:AraC family transcriptional regulator [Pseudoalteromonas sp. OOF1S-7]MCG7535571.1 AraC family transcriptional regulator [Pseudoalteromonas sp. OOF1S-7]
MKRTAKFTLSPHCLIMFKDLDLDPARLLKQAKLPADLWHTLPTSVNAAQYFDLWHAMEAQLGETLPLKLAQHLNVEAFDPAIFACLCSADLSSAMHRLSSYKPLIGPLTLDVQEDNQGLLLRLDCYGYDKPLPKSLGLCELAFFTQLARLATRSEVVPKALYVTQLPDNPDDFDNYFGTHLTLSSQVAIRFSAEDANRPFMTENAAMWSFFENDLARRLAELDASASMTQKVKALLMELLPSGQVSAEQVAAKLAISKRTLQRKLDGESANFQSLLSALRSELARQYLRRSSMSLQEIAFLLGFSDANTFIRAFSQWNGVSPGQFRSQHAVCATKDYPI